MNFFKTFLASCLGSLLAFIVLCVLGFFLLVGMVASFSDSNQQVVVKDQSVLHLKLDGTITENEIEDPLEDMPIPGIVSSTGLLPLKRAIKNAKDDSKIKGIYLEVGTLMGGYGVARELREALVDFRKSGKWIIAYSEYYTESAYYLASAADKVYLNPEGELEFNGLSVEVSFFKKLFDKLDIKPQIFRVGDFKSAVEPFMLDRMSTENKLQLNEMIEDIHQTILNDVSATRNIDGTRLREIADKMLVVNTATSVEYGLVDSLVYFDQVQAELRSRLGLSDKAKINLVKYGKYKRSLSNPSSSKNEIAVIVADGEIVSGKAQDGLIGSDTFAEELRKARTNDRIKAIVIRINSPGGSALASDVMWREINLASEVKPVIASMSDYAASGGYYLAMACDTIVAQPTTITGSIGVFSVLFDMSNFLDNKLGITFEEVKTGEIGELITMTRPLNSVEKNIWQKKTEEIYKGFTTKAAAGRAMPVDELMKVASGRVWTGTQAKERGLVDVLGNFETAVTLAAGAAGLGEDYRLKYYPIQKSFFEQWLGGLEESAETRMLKRELGVYFDTYQYLKKLKNYQGSQMRMPYELTIE
ncbi:MAG TPA: signal peptide peptidase SppA [Cyclobacteriaceae bacterium]|jgi:protease-4|nr:signal peptide peptidase SppA [Cytophagales bacterium]HRE66336.1 signal peptide peptidase SppA [Cyclobacteriaceae bacterium]HRF32842.1 signal peptide peptidase SppA [Cyclobacteriaceae bacterium]